MSTYDDWKKNQGVRVKRTDSVSSRVSQGTDGIPVGGEASNLRSQLTGAGIGSDYVNQVMAARVSASRAPSVVSDVNSTTGRESLIMRLGRVESALTKLTLNATQQKEMIQNQTTTLERQEKLINQQATMIEYLARMVAGSVPQSNNEGGSVQS